MFTPRTELPAGHQVTVILPGADGQLTHQTRPCYGCVHCRLVQQPVAHGAGAFARIPVHVEDEW